MKIKLKYQIVRHVFVTICFQIICRNNKRYWQLICTSTYRTKYKILNIEFM